MILTDTHQTIDDLYAFYFFGINDFQDMTSTMLQAIKTGKKCWVCLFDCLKSKRQFYNYTSEELEEFIRSICTANKLEVPDIDFYGQEDKTSFETDYELKKPNVVFMQNAVHKFPLWYPRADKSSVIHFAWGLDSKENLHASEYEIKLNVLRNENDIAEYNKKCSFIKNEYFGNMRLEQFSWKPHFSTLKLGDSSKICFIPEIWFGAHRRTFGSNMPIEKVIPFLDKVIDFLKERNYYVVWKRREKGQGAKVINPLPLLKNKPDSVVEKDLNFPSSLYYLAKKSDICLFYGLSNAQKDINEIGDNSILLSAQLDHYSEIEKLKKFMVKRKKSKALPSGSPSMDLIRYIEEHLSSWQENR